MSGKTAIVVTTIFDPAFLPGYLKNFAAYDRRDATTLYIIPDRKTPATVAEAAADAREQGWDVQCPEPAEQEDFLRRLGVPEEFIPWNTDNRRNVGYLMALADGCGVLVSIDDDNFCRDGVDFVGGHEVVGQVDRGQWPVIEANAAAWVNICSMLETDCSADVYPRGFPYFARGRDALGGEDAAPAGSGAQPIVAINAGLWLGDPDVDAVTRLSLAPQALAFDGPSVLLGPNVWTPINTQNTALSREAAAAYYYIRMGFQLDGLTIDRYGDILSGYFVQKCAKHLGQAVRVGSPVADHVRTTHNLFKDLYYEQAGMVIIEDLLPWLVEEHLEGSTFVEAYASLADHLARAASQFQGFVWDGGGREFLRETATRMEIWLKVVERLG